MGHWQQIGRDNAEERRRRAALPWWRRSITRQARAAALAAVWIAVFFSALAVLRRILL